MLKIFVTGDNHIGLKYAHRENAAFLASCRITAFEGMVDAANREECDIFAITGDLFENVGSVTKQDISALLEILSRFMGIVAVLPGNHDYYDKNARVWRYFKELSASCGNILLLSDSRPYELAAGEKRTVLYPAPCSSLHSAPGENNLGWIKKTKIENDGAYHIGIAHGAVEGESLDREGKYFLMKRRELEEIPVDAWLIGHTHVPFPNNLGDNFSVSGKIFNAGTHVQTDVSCGTEGVCFIVEIAPDKTVRAKKHISGNMRFYRRSVSACAGELESALMHELSDISDNSVVEVNITGAVTAEEYENKDKIAEKALSRFIEGSYNDYSLSRLISAELIKSEFPETSLSAGLLFSLLDEPKEAQLAYELLKTLKEGG